MWVATPFKDSSSFHLLKEGLSSNWKSSSTLSVVVFLSMESSKVSRFMQ